MVLKLIGVNPFAPYAPILSNMPVKGPHDYAQQIFRIFWVGIHFRGNVEDKLWSTIKSKHVMSLYTVYKFSNKHDPISPQISFKIYNV